MTVNFSLLALDQIVDAAAALRHMSGGQFSVPLVVRMATGAGRQLAAQHSHSLEGWYAHIPGIKVVAPATVEDAYGMLPIALADPDPVVIFEHVQLYNTATDVADLGPTDISRAAIRRSGSDVTVVTYGGSLSKTLDAANQLSLAGIDCEVIDLRVLRPLDTDAIIESVPEDPPRRNRRRRLAHRQSSGRDQRANRRGCVLRPRRTDRSGLQRRGADAVQHLEQAALPQPDKIVAAVKNLFGQPS